MAERRYRLAVVGGGPAGLMTAIAAAREGVHPVILLEAKTSWGQPVRCAEFVPKLITRDLDVPPEAVANRVSRLAVYLEDRLLRTIPAPGFILNRDILERRLAEKAESLGVTCSLGARVERVGEDGLACGGEGLSADLIVGADGPGSLVRRAMALPPNECALGAQ